MYQKEGGWWEVYCLEEIGTKAIEHKSENAANLVAASLGMVGMMAAEKNLTNTLAKSIKSLTNISDYAWCKGLENVMKAANESLLLIHQTPPEPGDLERE